MTCNKSGRVNLIIGKSVSVHIPKYAIDKLVIAFTARTQNTAGATTLLSPVVRAIHTAGLDRFMNY